MIIAIEALTFGLTRLVDAAKKYDCQILLLSKDLSVYDYELNHVDHNYLTTIEMDTNDFAAISKIINNLEKVDGILNLTDTWSLITLDLAEQLALPMQNAASVRLCRNKYQLRNYLFERHLTQSPSIFYQKGRPLQFLKTLTYPLIVKDIAGTGSANVWLAKDQKALEQLLVQIDYDALRGDGVLIESQFHGTLYSAESVSYQGETRVYALTSRLLSREPYFREEMAATSVSFPAEKTKEIVEWVKTVLAMVGYNHGMSHLEFMVTTNGLEVIEINPRMAGALVSEAACQAFNYNFMEAEIELALGRRPTLLDADLTLKQGMACAVLYADKTGIFSHIEGLESLPLSTGNIKFYPTAQVGKKIAQLDNQSANLGFLLASGESSEQALLNAAAAVGRLQPIMQPS